MKKIVKRPDGTEETVEGTAEEIAEYERRLRGETNEGRKKPPILKGKELEDEILRLVNEELERRKYQATIDWQRFFQEFKWPAVDPAPYQFQTACWYCGLIGCNQVHTWCGTVTSGQLLMEPKKD